MNEITLQELAKLKRSEYILVDIRDDMSFNYGHIPGAINIPVAELSEKLPSSEGKN
ncbi:hypothetical protein P261_02192 [Lachnospiraceae bacterium TWA4]|nr:hypothetical protein P261_02192 [Lachnospiraceae bacterium TWA4]